MSWIKFELKLNWNRVHELLHMVSEIPDRRCSDVSQDKILRMKDDTRIISSVLICLQALRHSQGHMLSNSLLLRIRQQKITADIPFFYSLKTRRRRIKSGVEIKFTFSWSSASKPDLASVTRSLVPIHFFSKVTQLWFTVQCKWLMCF